MLTAAAAATASAVLVALVVSTAGYVITTGALEKSDANVKLALGAFEELFNEFTDPTDAGPFAEEGKRPPPKDEWPGQGPRFDPPHRGRPGRGMPGKTGQPPRPPGEGGPPNPRPGMPGGPGLSARELAVLGSVLSFYDKFAERNETNSRLQYEAAKGFRKVAVLYRMSQREDKAREAQSRAVKGFESLIARYGEEPRYRYELARTLATRRPG